MITMNKYALALAWLFLSTGVQAQNVINGEIGSGAVIEAYDKDGRPLTAGTNGRIEGSPYLCPDWCPGSVLFSNGKTASPIFLRFDLEKNALFFRQDGKFYRFVDTVSAFAMQVQGLDSVNRNWKFRNGYARDEKKRADPYYQVLEEGPRAHLLYHTYASLVDKYVYGGPEKQAYQLHQDLYLYDPVAGKLTRIRPDRTAVLDALPSSANEVRAWLTGRAGEELTREDLFLLVRYLNRTAK
jgi:hypothetical protein